MQKLRKSLAAILAVIMLISVFAFGASAGVDPIDASATQNIAMKLEVEHADGSAATSVNPGETVTVNVYVTAKDAEARIYGGMFLIFWNSDIYTYVEGSRTWGLDSVDPESLYAVSGTQAAYTNTVAKMTDEEKAYGWNTAGNFQVKNAAGTTNTNASLIQENAATPFISIKLEVSDSVEPGTKAPIGIPTTAIAPLNTTRQNYTYIQTWTAASKTVTQNKAKNLYVLNTIAADLAVAGGETPAAPVLTKTSAQVKMTPNSATTVEDAFQFRVVSKISDADWNTYFANTGVADATTNAITSVGFVAYKGTEGFSLDTAKAVAAGTAADGYSVATTNYIQHTDGADAQFGCCLEIRSAETRSDLTYVAFAQYVDATGAAQVVFYDAAYEALLATNYTGIVAAYLAAFPFAG